MGHFGAQLDNCVRMFVMGHRKTFSLMELPMNSAITS